MASFATPVVATAAGTFLLSKQCSFVVSCCLLTGLEYSWRNRLQHWLFGCGGRTPPLLDATSAAVRHGPILLGGLYFARYTAWLLSIPGGTVYRYHPWNAARTAAPVPVLGLCICVTAELVEMHSSHVGCGWSLSTSLRGLERSYSEQLARGQRRLAALQSSSSLVESDVLFLPSSIT